MLITQQKHPQIGVFLYSSISEHSCLFLLSKPPAPSNQRKRMAPHFSISQSEEPPQYRPLQTKHTAALSKEAPVKRFHVCTGAGEKVLSHNRPPLN